MSGLITYFTSNHCAELIGTMGNIFIVSAFSVRGEKKIRTLSIIGSCISLIYNYLLHSTSFFLLSLLIIAINLYNIIFLKPE